MIGVHVNDNVFKCATLGSLIGPVFADHRTVRWGMHTCPMGSVMVGLPVVVDRAFGDAAGVVAAVDVMVQR